MRQVEFAPRLQKCPSMSSAGVVVEVVKDHSALHMIARPPGQCRDLFLQLFDQSQLVGGNDIHAALLTASS
jgi:hypothetical protein